MKVKKMSRYTIKLGDYINLFSLDQPTSIPDKIEKGRTKLFDFDYPIFDEEYRQTFETHFIRNFYMREIGFETEELFKFNLENWLIINMPYWNNMFESELTYNGVNPLKNSLMDVTHTKKNDGSQSSSSDQNFQHDSNTGNDVSVNHTNSSFNRNLESDNPDSRLNLTTQDGKGVIEYASSITEDSQNNTASETTHSGGKNSSTEKTNQSGKSNVNNVEDFSQHREGKIGVQTYSKMIQEHRQALIRIENMIFKEMNQLFMLIY
jgi:hypothetical protein